MHCLRFFVSAVIVSSCALPKNVVRTPSSAMVDTKQTTIGERIAPSVAAHPGESGFLLYNTGAGAIQARVALADAAQSSLDAQYYEWAGDAIGRVLVDRIIEAANRGVRVRLLIDDYSESGHDIGFQTLDAHPNIEVRVYNPYARGVMRFLQYFGRFTELNRRMHNKMFVVDGKVAVIGGRNLTDDYFGLGKKLSFRDFDLLAIGPVVAQAEGAFDQYWNSRWAYPVSSLVKPVSQAKQDEARLRFYDKLKKDLATFPYALPRDRQEALAWLEQFRGKAIWGPGEVVYSDPNRPGKPKKAPPGIVWNKMFALAKEAKHEIVAENAYLVPQQKNAPGYRKLRQRGVTVRLLTNSLATTDVVPVNAHYANTRPDLVEAGIELYEMKPWAPSRELYIAHASRSKAHLALHGKAAVFDRKTVFVGSFNLDPRSAALDTETVFVVQSPELAEQFLDAFATDFDPANAWRIGKVAGKRKVAWITEQGAERIVVEPHDPASGWRRFVRSIETILPIRSLL
jgi:putative cardiolipin synthase